MWIVYMKEMLGLLRDRKTLIFTVLIPIFALPAMGFGFGYVSHAISAKAQTREIIGRRTQTTGGNHAARALERLLHSIGDFIGIIGDCRTSCDRDADLAQRACEKDGVGVDGRAEQEFVTDGDDLDGVGHEL